MVQLRTVQAPSWGATVKVLNPATGVELNATTTDASAFRLPSLSTGTYKITGGAPGFKSAVRENIVLAVAQTLTVDFKLEVGAVTDSITVSSDPPLLETGTAKIGSYVSKKEFDSWPIIVGDGRRQLQKFIFTALPGTVGSTWQGSINGGQNFSHEILIDGIAIGRMDLAGGANNEFSPSTESVSEFKLQTGTVIAQYSGGQTAVANFATKSGTSSLHGSGYYYGQNEALRANAFNSNAAGIPHQPIHQHNYGYSVGGPVYIPKVYDGRNKCFFFHNMERTTAKNYSSTAFTRLPTTDFKHGDFNRLFSSAFTGNAGSGTRSRWNPVSTKILDVAGIDDPQLDQMLNNTAAFASGSPEFRERMLTFKGDHNFNVNNRISGRFNRNFRTRYNSGANLWGPPPGLPTNVYQNQDTPGTMVRLAYDVTLRPTLLGHFALGYNRFGNVNESAHVDQYLPSKIGLENVPGTNFPVLNFTGNVWQGGGIGSNNRLGSENRGASYNGSTIGQADLTYIRGSHNFRFGVENRRYYSNTRNKSSSGVFNFSPNQTAQPGFINQTGHAFASFLLGDFASSSLAVSPNSFGHRWRTGGFYFQDDWKVNRKLTLNIGMRWEIVGGLLEVAQRQSGFSLSAANPVAADVRARLFSSTTWAAKASRTPIGSRFRPSSASPVRSATTAPSTSTPRACLSGLPKTALATSRIATPISPECSPTSTPHRRTISRPTTTPLTATGSPTFRTENSAFNTNYQPQRFSKSTTSATRARA